MAVGRLPPQECAAEWKARAWRGRASPHTVQRAALTTTQRTPAEQALGRVTKRRRRRDQDVRVTDQKQGEKRID